MSDMKCPFCKQELHKDSDGYYTCYTDNCGCWANGGNGASGSESLWLTLIRTKKQLDRAIWWLNEIVESHRCTPISTAEMALAEIKMKKKADKIAQDAINQIKALDNKG